ncbi:MAG TPA: hypothetical protein VJP79_00245 [Nitrososphaera sp.]|nr:hypothetical protein [Nitrososphaera sp.]
MGIKIIKEKKFEDFTFIDDGLKDLSRQQDAKAETKKDISAPDFRLRNGGKSSKLKKSRMMGGHGMQGHSPVYE